MPVITISRGSFIAGKMLAQALAIRLGYRCIDRDQIIQKAASWGVPQADLRAAIEQPLAPLGQLLHTKYVYLAFIQAALTQEVRKGNAIYHGLAGHLLLGKGSHILRTRVIAPMEFRISKMQEAVKCNRKEAIAFIEQMDADRRKWTQFLYGVDWGDASLYDLVLNLEQMTLQEACDVICTVAHLKCFASTPETQKALEDLATASRIKACLAMNPMTSGLQFEIVVRGPSVCIKGEITNDEQVNRIGGIARAVPGVIEVHMDELAVLTHS